MQILILGAGATGGYLGANLIEGGGDVTFLVRGARAEVLRRDGLRVSSGLGDLHIAPNIVAREDLRSVYDVVILSCKAYDLEAAVEAVLPAVGGDTVILPLLNGVAHLAQLDARFGQERTVGGLAHLAVDLTPDGEVRHLNDFSRFMAGARGKHVPRALTVLDDLLASTYVEFSVSENIEQDMWEKFVFLTTLASATCTMRARIGDIVATRAGRQFILGLLSECEQVAGASHHAPGPTRLAEYRSQLTEEGSTLSASMLRAIERGAPTEAEHVVGDMLRRGECAGVHVPLLRIAYTHLQAYELRRRLT